MVKKVVKKTYKAVMWVVATLITLAIAGFFISGATMNTFLGFLPLIVHKIVGWLIIAGVIIGVIGAANKWHK